MARNRNSAKQAGARFERVIADCLRDYVSEFIDRRVKTGAADKGDLSNLRTQQGHRVVAELKDYGGRFEVGSWLKEVETERVNDDARVGVVIAKRRGHADPLDQVVIMTVRDYIALTTETRPD